jgi:hypothetical protein
MEKRGNVVNTKTQIKISSTPFPENPRKARDSPRCKEHSCIFNFSLKFKMHSAKIGANRQSKHFKVVMEKVTNTKT